MEMRNNTCYLIQPLISDLGDCDANLCEFWDVEDGGGGQER